MKRVLISKLKGGEVLAQEVCDDKGVQWLTIGTTYKENYFHQLSRLGIESIYIKDDLTHKTLTPEKEFQPEALSRECKALTRRQLKRFKKSGSINVYKYEKFVYAIMSELTESINVIENMYQIRDYNQYTYEHSVNVTVIGIMISKGIGFSRDQIHDIAMGCILHDLGKSQITEEILNKPAKLTKEEFTQIKKHSAKGYNIVKDHKNIKTSIKEIILTHHEKLDGSGYPLGISGAKISTGTRICTVADVFDAMCSKRPYKNAIPFAEAIRIMRVSMNKQLDMDICSVLENVLK